MNFTRKLGMRAVAAAFAFAGVTAFAQSSLEIRQDRLQLQSDRAALQRQIGRLSVDEARLKSDAASGRMSAESKDAYAVYQAEKSVDGGMDGINAQRATAPQMKLDKSALQRQLKRLDIAEKNLKADKASGKSAAESRDSKAIAEDKLAIKGGQEVIAAGNPGSLQMKSDVAALQRAMKRLDADEAAFKADKAAGKMSAESRDSFAVYQAGGGVKGAKKNVATDESASLQLSADRATLQRQLKRLELAEARLAGDSASGKSAAQSKDSTAVSRDQQAIKAQTGQIAADKAELKSDRKK